MSEPQYLVDVWHGPLHQNYQGRYWFDLEMFDRVAAFVQHCADNGLLCNVLRADSQNADPAKQKEAADKLAREYILKGMKQ